MTHPSKNWPLILLSLLIASSGCLTDSKNKFQKEIAIKTDTLNIDNTKDTLVVNSKGTVLFFPKDVFVFPDGTQPKTKISIEVKECLSVSEMIRENLTTMSNNQILETRGMIYVAAFSDDKELQIKQGKSYKIHFPKDTTEKNKAMNLFYGNYDKNGDLNWNVDTQSILKPIAKIKQTTWTYGCIPTENEGYFTLREDTSMNVYEFFNKKFDNKKLSLGGKLLKKDYLFSFTKLKNGDLINKKVLEVSSNFSDGLYSTKPVKDPEIDKYIIDFFFSIPSLNPDYCVDPLDTDGSIRIDFSYTPAYANDEGYNNLFNQKYSMFKNQSIKTMNDAELNYFIFSSSKLGWINCDYFWETREEKIDYIVKADPNSKPNIKLVFKQSKSIMAGNLEGNRYVFKNVPINQEIKIVAIAFNGTKPLLSVSETKTSKQIFDKFQYRDFTITDLEQQLNNP